MCKRQSLRHKVERAARLAGSLEEYLDSILNDLHTHGIPAAVKRAVSGTMPNPSELPAQPVSSLTVRIGPKGDSQVCIDADKPFHLPTRLTELLLYAASGLPGADGIVSSRLATDAAEILMIRKGSVSNLIYRLRDKLRKQGLNPSLLETRRSPSDTRFRFLTKKLNVIKDLRTVIENFVQFPKSVPQRQL